MQGVKLLLKTFRHLALLQWDSVISVGGTPYRYCPSISSQKAFDMGRRQISLGETHNFRQRRGRYLAAQGWTNVYQGAARLLDGGKVDTITAFADHIVVVVPNVRGVQPLDRKIVETLLILGFGLRRTTKKPWGLQKNCIDVKSYHHFVNDEIANTIRWKIWEDLVENGPKTAAGFCQVKPAWSSQYWKDLLIWISQEVEIVAQADGSDTRQSSGPTSTASQAKPTYCIEAVQRILGNRSWKEDLQDYPPFPIEFWSNAGLAGVPKELMGLYETSSDLVDGAENGKDEDSQLERTSRKRSNELASLNPRNAKRKASKAAAKAAKLTQISDEENIPVEAATTATSSTTIQAPRQKRPGPPKGATSKLSFKF